MAVPALGPVRARQDHGGRLTGDAGRFALGVFGAHWTMRQLRATDLLFEVTGHRLVVAVPEKEKTPGSGLTVVEVVPRGRITARDTYHRPWRQRRRVDLLFPDGTWVALKLPSPTAAGELRAVLTAPAGGGSPPA